MPEPAFTVDGNRLTLVTEGPERLNLLLETIAGARRTLRVLYYIYVDDQAGARVREALIAAAARGVTVSLIVDGLGSEHAAAHEFFQPIREAGAHVCRFVPRWGRRYLLRNHQKLALADENRALIGGFNVEDDYFATGKTAWRDLGMLVEGPAAARLAGYYDALEAWAKTPRAPLRRLRRALVKWSEEEGRLRWLLGGPTPRLSPWARTLRADMREARLIDVIAGYFAPSPAMLRALYGGGRRGRVRIVLPAKTDHGAAIWASRFTYAGLLRHGAQLFEYQPSKLHTKLFVIDDVVAVGSANFDIRSMFLNLELMLRVEDRGLADHARHYVDGEIAASEAITPDLYKARTSPWTRAKQAAAFFVMTTLDYNVTRRLNFGRRRGG